MSEKSKALKHKLEERKEDKKEDKEHKHVCKHCGMAMAEEVGEKE